MPKSKHQFVINEKLTALHVDYDKNDSIVQISQVTHTGLTVDTKHTEFTREIVCKEEPTFKLVIFVITDYGNFSQFAELRFKTVLEALAYRLTLESKKGSDRIKELAGHEFSHCELYEVDCGVTYQWEDKYDIL